MENTTTFQFFGLKECLEGFKEALAGTGANVNDCKIVKYPHRFADTGKLTGTFTNMFELTLTDSQIDTIMENVWYQKEQGVKPPAEDMPWNDRVTFKIKGVK